MIILFIGLPGTGKGKVAEIISKKYGMTYFSMGAHFREIVKKKGEHAQEIASYIDKGNYVPSELTAKIFMKWLVKNKNKDVLLDRFPGNLGNALAIEGKLDIDRVLNFIADEETLIDRLSSRVVCGKCGKPYNLKYDPPKRNGKCDECGAKLVRREDDKPEVIRKRIEAHKKQLNPLVKYYKEIGLVSEIDANFGIDEIDKITGQIDEVVVELKEEIKRGNKK